MIENKRSRLFSDSTPKILSLLFLNKLGDFTGHCVGEPKKCTDGISISIWVQLPQNTDNATHFILSSGEQVHRGFTIYQRDVDKLGAAVTDGRKRWVAEVTYLPYVKQQDGKFSVVILIFYILISLLWRTAKET